MSVLHHHAPCIIIGAGPAGLIAASELSRFGHDPVVLEKDSNVGGLARTEYHRGYRFDIGGHRFFTKSEHIAGIWEDMLGTDLLTVRRQSRIYYQDRFLRYPLSFLDTLLKLGPVEGLRILGSYLRAKARKHAPEETFEQWVSNRFGRRLYEIFFKTYTEKVWGVSCDRIMADWAAQRIKGLSLLTALSHAMLGNSKARSLTEEFQYPRKGPGMMWERLQERIEEKGGMVRLRSEVTCLHHDQSRITGLSWSDEAGRCTVKPGSLISTLPLGQLIAMLDPPPPSPVLEAAENLSYRSFLIVGLILNEELPLEDQWIYVHSPEVKVGRIQVFKNWSPELVPYSGKDSLGLEYFCDEDDDLWNLEDRHLVELAGTELSRLGLANRDSVEDGIVIRQPKAYPVYTQGYQDHLQTIRSYLSGFENLQSVGRNGTHRYNNMDHSMLSGILAAENVLGAGHDSWQVNSVPVYHEEVQEEKLASTLPRILVKGTLARIDQIAFGISTGVLACLVIFLATVWLLIKGGEVVGPHLQLLSNYFPGYTMNFKGAVLGGCYGFMYGGALGWLFASMRNILIAFQLYRIRRKYNATRQKDFLDHL